MELSRLQTPASEGVANPLPRPVFAPREMCPDADICRRCEEVLHELKWPAIDHLKEQEYPYYNDDEAWIQDIQVGTIAEMAATTDCALCSFLLQILNEEYHKESQPPGERVGFTQLSGSCYIKGNYQGPGRITRQGMRKIWELVVGYEDSNPRLRINAWIHLLAESKDQVSNGEEIIGLGLSVDHSPCDIGFIKGCYDTCRLRCEGCEQPKDILGKCLNNNSARDVPQDMRVIDVLGKCIMLAPQGCRYFALSHCWGKGQSLRLTKDNYLQLTQKGGLDTASGITETVQDAIEVTGLCNERFLWVDSLCIIQDDDADKSAQIYQMDKIYRHAALTIVAAGDDVGTKGLPGLKHGSRFPPVRSRVEVRGLTFQPCPPLFWEAIMYTRWQSRAWTYQEAQMSKRQLVFTPNQIFYECKTMSLGEAFVPDVEFIREALDPKDPGKKRKAERLYMPSEYQMECLEQAFEVITQRQLTYESDILNAISGLLTAIGQAHNESFLCGMLVSSLLEHSMLWTPMENLRRRKPNAEGHHFPSWSWAGWVGRIDYKGGGQFSVEGPKYSERREINAWSTILPDGRIIHDKELECAQWALQIQSCKLRFKSEVAIFLVDSLRCRTPYGYRSPDGVPTYRIFHSELWIGSVILSREGAEKFFAGVKYLEFCFIKLSRSPSSLGGRKEMPDYTIDIAPLHDPVRLSTKDDDPGVHNVMMVEWKDGIAYRLAVGKIHVHGWQMGNREEREIILG